MHMYNINTRQIICLLFSVNHDEAVQFLSSLQGRISFQLMVRTLDFTVEYSTPARLWGRGLMGSSLAPKCVKTKGIKSCTCCNERVGWLSAIIRMLVPFENFQKFGSLLDINPKVSIMIGPFNL